MPPLQLDGHTVTIVNATNCGPVTFGGNTVTACDRDRSERPTGETGYARWFRGTVEPDGVCPLKVDSPAGPSTSSVTVEPVEGHI
jgi:hypothetical protein